MKKQLRDKRPVVGHPLEEAFADHEAVFLARVAASRWLFVPAEDAAGRPFVLGRPARRVVHGGIMQWAGRWAMREENGVGGPASSQSRRPRSGVRAPR